MNATTAERLDRQPVVYRLFGESGDLLYVGLSTRSFHRLADHVRSRDWAGDVRRFELEPVANLEAGRARERAVIAAERPRHNVMHLAPLREPRASTHERLLTVAEVAQRLRVDQETVRRWLRSKRLRGALMGGKRGGYRIPVSEVERIASGGMPPEQASD